MAEENIERIEELVTKFIEKNRKIVHTKITRLTAPGENNCSLVLKVDVTTTNEHSTEEVLNAVAKVIPTNKFMKFSFANSFKNEVAFYDYIVPTLQEFQRKQGVDQVVDFFPKVYVSRQNLNGDCDIVDDNAVLLMENLTMSVSLDMGENYTYPELAYMHMMYEECRGNAAEDPYEQEIIFLNG